MNAPPPLMQLRALSGAFYGKEHLDAGGKIILPNSVMLTLAHYNVSFPMMFKLTSSRGRSTHCGVLEFTAEEGQVLMPLWMMDLLMVNPSDIVTIASVTLPPGKFVKLRPQTQDFIKNSNPKAVLENALTSFSCLTRGDTIPIFYNGKTFLIDIRETKAVGNADVPAICIVEADVEVDFERPLDMPDSPKHAPSASTAGGSRRGVSPPPGGAGGIVFGSNTANPVTQGGVSPAGKPTTSASTPAVEEPVKVAFPGSGRTLSGKPVATGSVPTPSSAGSTAPSAPSSSASEGPKPASGFVPFSGKGRSLK